MILLHGTAVKTFTLLLKHVLVYQPFVFLHIFKLKANIYSFMFKNHAAS